MIIDHEWPLPILTEFGRDGDRNLKNETRLLTTFCYRYRHFYLDFYHVSIKKGLFKGKRPFLKVKITKNDGNHDILSF